MQRLLLEATLDTIWERYRESTDADVDWTTLLSIGEQQRILFCRLFWHHDWHLKHGDGNAFYAILDESTSALDSSSEAAIYSRCQERGLSYISVAHRVTVIRYHDVILQLKTTGWELQKASDLADKVAEQITGAKKRMTVMTGK